MELLIEFVFNVRAICVTIYFLTKCAKNYYFPIPNFIVFLAFEKFILPSYNPNAC